MATTDNSTGSRTFSCLMSKLGIHFPNAGFRNLDALWSIPWDHFVVLHTDREWVPEIRLRFPQATILVRAYLENWATTEPLGWARSIAQWANELRPFGVALTFANEQNLAAEGHPLGARAGAEYPPASVYHDILRWNATVIRELKTLLPWATLHFPALSQGHSDDKADAGYVGFEILREAVELCDVLDVHIYWDESNAGQRQAIDFGERYRLAHAHFPNKPLFVSEFGMLSSDATENGEGVTDWLAALPGYVTGACWFIWDSDLKNQPWILTDNSTLVQALRTFGLKRAAPLPAESIFSPIAIAERLIMSVTGFSPTGYASAGGNKHAIGYGHLISQGYSHGNSLTEHEARKLLRDDLVECLRELEQKVNIPLTTNQKAALLSLIYDLGSSSSVASVLDHLNASHNPDPASIRQRWQSANGGNSQEGLWRRHMESGLYLRDMVAANLSASTTRTRAVLPSIAGVHFASTAPWLSVKQGRRFKVVGVWYDADSRHRVGASDFQAGAAKKSGEIAVRVEDDSGLGIPAELVVRRWNHRHGDCEPQLTDAMGTVRFALDLASEFSPAVGRGPDRIHIGDCTVSGLGTPIPQNGEPSPPIYFIRIRKDSVIA